MKKFLQKTGIFILIGLVPFVIIFYTADGYTDPFYLRVTSQKQNSLIMGTSRAAQGIIPSVLNEELGRDDVYNFSFTLAHSPFGPTYLSAIQKKLKNDAKNGLFIVAVDPWSVSSISEDPNNLQAFRENKLFLNKLESINQNPNVPYLLKYYKEPFFNIFQKTGSLYLHEDGWLEVTIDMEDTVVVNQRIKDKLALYTSSYLPEYSYSQKRYSSLEEIVGFLQGYGKVFLVRLPVHPGMLEIENQLLPNFDTLMNELSTKYDVPYLNFTKDDFNYRFTDGHHLYKSSGILVTKKIAESVKQ